MGKLYVGIDISKDRSSANGIDDHGRSRDFRDVVSNYALEQHILGTLVLRAHNS
jgi:hypothetical protein